MKGGTHATAGFRFWFPFDVEGEGVPRSRSVGACVVAIRTQTRAVEADETDIDTVIAVLRWSLSTAPYFPVIAEIVRTWLSKHCVHSSR